VKLSVSILLFTAAAFGQAPVVTKVLNVGIGDTSFAPLTIVYIYGTFPKGLPKDFAVTVGGRPGYVNVANSTGYITAVLPSDAPLGMQPLVVSYQGANSDAFPIALTQYAPEFETTAVVPVTPQGPVFPLPSYFPFAHQNLTPVTAAAPAAPGEQLVSLLSGVGPTSPPIKLGGINSFSTLAVQPTMSVDGTAVPIVRAGSSDTSVEVDFVIPKDAPVGFDQVVLTIAGVQSNVVTIPVGGQPFVTAVLNAGSFRSPGTVAPGSIVSIFGAGFGPSDSLSTFPKTSVNSTTVMFGTTPAPLFAVAALEGQINALVPSELPTSGTVDLMIKDNSGTSTVLTLTLAPAVPGMFFLTDPSLPSRRNVIALLADSAWIAMPVSMGAALGLPAAGPGIGKGSTCAQPAHIGDVVQLFVTGLGLATPGGDPAGKTLASGTVAPATGSPLYETVDTPMVTIGGLPAPVQFSGIAPGFAGLYQVNVQIPAGIQPGDDVPIQISMPGSLVDTATIAVSGQ
jgi:uncharacterized protein (TIGR03437 family)